MTSYVLGLDGGATKTISVVLDQDQSVLGRAEAGPSNHQNVGEEAAEGAIRLATQSALEACDHPPIEAACWGMAGLDRAEDERIIRRMAERVMPEVPVTIVHDSTIALVGGTRGDRFGVVIIAGTGSIAVAYHPDGDIARSGGWGHLLGDEGSGYDIARRGLNAVTRAADGRAPGTSLIEDMINAAGASSVEGLADRIYLESWGITEIAALAPVVVRAAEQGDSTAHAIMEYAAEELALAAEIAVGELGMADLAFSVVLTGGIFAGSALLRERISDVIGEFAPRAEPTLPKAEPVIGAALIALDRASEL